MCYCVESCVQKYIQVQVPEMLEPGYVVSQGIVQCFLIATVKCITLNIISI